MSQVKGSKKTGGRKKGTPNKRTKQVDDILDTIKCAKASDPGKTQTGYEPIADLIAVRDFAWNMVHEVPPRQTGKYLDIIAFVGDKLKKLKWGEKTQVEHTGEDGAPLWESLIDMLDDDYKR